MKSTIVFCILYKTLHIYLCIYLYFSLYVLASLLFGHAGPVPVYNCVLQISKWIGNVGSLSLCLVYMNNSLPFA